MAYWGRFNTAHPSTLPVAGAFQPAGGRPWLVRFWELEGKYIGIAFPYGLPRMMMTILWLNSAAPGLVLFLPYSSSSITMCR